MINRRILVIEDEVNIQELIKYNLEKNGYKVMLADNGIDGLEEALANVPDLILLDLMLPGLDGLEVCKRLRTDKRTKKIPIFMLTAKSEELDKVLGLELGADDYITKPFSIKELVARVRAAMRRITDEGDEEADSKEINKVLKVRDIEIDCEKYEVKKSGEKLVLTLKEFELLKMLVENKGKVLTRDFLLDKIWGYDYAGETRTVDVHIRHVRQKISDEEGSGQMIETIRGVGYRFNSEGDK
ncbi:MAG TPA: response regulator transcription factor [Candidatus Nitrosocosmicus sp.]|nr:response regulator transcription factor [Candidatus Nitrosocosmicus sp.]